jgi:hypothetical protein
MLDVDLVNPKDARALCLRWHYSNIFPPHCMVHLGFHDERGLAGVAIWGWGTRPRHTIRRLFPSLDTPDYWELCRLCCRDDLPRNTESQLLAACTRWFRKHQPEKVVLFTWADGIRGKPGYVYQAAGWLYGGFITTEIYLTAEGEPVHPRFMITRFGTRRREVWTGLGLRKVWGRQFRYVKFLCGHARRKRLLRESPVEWTRLYPKTRDLAWAIDAGEGSRETRDPPRIERTGRFRQPALIATRPLLLKTCLSGRQAAAGCSPACAEASAGR